MNYAILFFILFVILGVISLVKRSDSLSAIFKTLGKGAFILLQIAMLAGFTIIISMLVGLLIGIHPLVLGTPHFLSGGEGIYILNPNDSALLQFSLTYGVLYIAIFFIYLRFLAKNKITRSFVNGIRKVRSMLPYRRHHKNLEGRLVAAACQLMTVVTMLVVYPIAIAVLFPDLSMTLTGNLLLFLCLLAFSLIPLPGYANSRRNQPLTRPKIKARARERRQARTRTVK